MSDETADFGGERTRGQQLRGPIGSARLGQDAYDGGLHPFGIGSRAPLSDPTEMPQHYPIKGNISSSVTRLYHRPDSTEYRSTTAEVWFDSPSAAEVAGFTLAESHPPGLTSEDFEPGGREHGWTRLDVENARHAALLGPVRPATASMATASSAARSAEDPDDADLRHSRVVDDRTVPAAPPQAVGAEQTEVASTSPLPATGGLAGLFANRTPGEATRDVEGEDLSVFGEITQPSPAAGGQASTSGRATSASTSSDAAPAASRSRSTSTAVAAGAVAAASGAVAGGALGRSAGARSAGAHSAGARGAEVTGEIPATGSRAAATGPHATTGSPMSRPTKQRPVDGAEQMHGAGLAAGATSTLDPPLRTRGVAAGTPGGPGALGLAGDRRLALWVMGGLFLVAMLGLLLSQCVGGGTTDAQPDAGIGDGLPASAESISISSTGDLQLRTRDALDTAGFAEVAVEVDGTNDVRLMGTVDSNADRMAAESAVASLDGMGTIKNELVVSVDPSAPLAQNQPGAAEAADGADEGSGVGAAGAATDDGPVADDGSVEDEAETPAADPVEKDPDYTG